MLKSPGWSGLETQRCFAVQCMTSCSNCMSMFQKSTLRPGVAPAERCVLIVVYVPGMRFISQAVYVPIALNSALIHI
jgi:hypothetical protein